MGAFFILEGRASDVYKLKTVTIDSLAAVNIYASPHYEIGCDFGHLTLFLIMLMRTLSESYI